jgi:uncharacterized membrane protein
MKKLRLNNLWAALLGVLLSATYVSAQKTVEIENNAGDKIKICMYKDTDQVRAVPYRCFVMTSLEKVTWKRTEGATPFVVRVFKSQLFDKQLFYQRLPVDTNFILIEKAKLRFSVETNVAQKYRLKVCNQRFDQEIYFALGLVTPASIVTEGWWSVAKGKCVEIGVSESLKSTWNIRYGMMPETYFYAESRGSNPLYWRGRDSAFNFCINDRKAFSKNEFETRRGKVVRTSCTAEDEKRVKFRRLGYPNVNQEYYYLTF